MKYAYCSSAVIRVFFALCLITARANAQFLPGNPSINPLAMIREMQYGPLMLLSRSEVQKELKLDKKQNEEIKKLQKEQMDLLKNQRGKGRGADTSEIMDFLKKMQAQQAEFNTKAKAVLTDVQKQRLREIRLQAIGIQSVFDPEVQTAVAATPEQKASLATLNTDYMNAKMSLMQDMQAMRSPGALKSRQAAIDNNFKEKVAKVLTVDQNALLKKMEGDPFKDLEKIKGAGMM